MNILGISGLHHARPLKRQEFPGLSERQHRIVQGLDSAAALITPEGVVAAAAEERFSREKGSGSFPAQAIRYCLESAGMQPDQLDYVAHGFCYEPFANELRAGDDYSRKLYDEAYCAEAQLRCFEEFLPGTSWANKFRPIPHHLAHAASAFYPSGFEEALILVTEGMGEVDSALVAVGRGNEIRVLKSIPGLHSLGLLYGVCTLHLGFWMNFDEYKVMGLAPYGDARRYFYELMDFVQLQEDGGYTVPLLAADRTRREKETHEGVLALLAERFGPGREKDGELEQHHMDLAASLQSVLQTCLLHLLRAFQRETGLRQLCLAGGVALNCSANGVIHRSRLFQHLFVQPAAGDDGTALGAALYLQRRLERETPRSRMTLPLWGPEFSSQACQEVLDAEPECQYVCYESWDELVERAARSLAQGRIIGWFQGRMEFGPRALGNRSILADPRARDMRERLNRLVKNREDFRPFAPAVCAESAADYFAVDAGDEQAFACMLIVAPVRNNWRERLPAITHVDGSARVQTVSQAEHPRFWSLLRGFEKEAGLPILLNTSFNVRGQPIVCTPKEALDTFLTTDIDELVLGDYYVSPSGRAERALASTFPANPVPTRTARASRDH